MASCSMFYDPVHADPLGPATEPAAPNMVCPVMPRIDGKNNNAAPIKRSDIGTPI